MSFKSLRTIALVPLALVLCHCDRVQSLFKEQPPKPTPYDFTFTLDITPAAAERLKAAHADFHMTTYFYGVAKPENRALADEMNRIRLGYQEWTYPGYTTRRIHIISSALDPKDLALTVDGKANVFMTVSATPAPQDREPISVLPTKQAADAPPPLPEGPLIECDGYTGPIDLAQAHPPVVHCDVYHP